MADGGTKAADAQPGRLEFVHHDVERRVRNVVEIRLRVTGHFHAAGFEMFPAEFQRRLNLAVNRVAGFVANACENHKGSIGTLGAPTKVFACVAQNSSRTSASGGPLLPGLDSKLGRLFLRHETMPRHLPGGRNCDAGFAVGWRLQTER